MLKSGFFRVISGKKRDIKTKIYGNPSYLRLDDLVKTQRHCWTVEKSNIPFESLVHYHFQL